jgi:hypothetical protein
LAQEIAFIVEYLDSMIGNTNAVVDGDPGGESKATRKFTAI